MKAKVLILVLCAFAVAVFSLPAGAQPPMPKPGPEHELLKKFEGEYDASMSFMGQESKGVAKYKMGLGGFWLMMHYNGDFGGSKFEGAGAWGYDPTKKKYVSTWVDSMSPSIMLMEGAFDKEGTTYTETGEGPGPDGKPQKMKSVYDLKDKDMIIFTMYNVMGDKDQEAFKITFKRKK
jgi:hypothetical protein